MIEKELINEIVAKANILEVISRFREVKKKGASYFCKSPFVDEKTPSCAISERKQIYTDFSSGKNGNVVSYLMDAENMTYIEAIKFLADIVGIVITDSSGKIISDKPKADYENRKANPDEEESGKYYELKEFTILDIKTIFAEKIIKQCEIEFKKANTAIINPTFEQQYAKLLNVLKKYNVHSCSQIRFIKNRVAHIYKSNDRYPIFVFDDKDFFKIYQPKHEEKSMRFLHGGAKPNDYIFGYEQTKKAFNDLKAKEQESEAESDEEEAKKEKQGTKLEAIIECTGERDALNVAALGYEIVCLSSESRIISPGKLANLFGMTKNYYRLPDIDLPGKKSNHDVCMCDLSELYLEIKTIQLPESLKKHKDFRGNACKDVRDYLAYYTPKHFHDLVKIAIPYRFWDMQFSYDKDGNPKKKGGKNAIKYEVNNVHMYNFLTQNGFYRYKTESEKDGFIFIQIKGNIVCEIDYTDIKTFIHNFLEDRKMDVDLRNMFMRSPQLSYASFSQLRFTVLDFTDYGKQEQFLFLKNKTWCVTPTQIIEYKIGGVAKYVWEKEVLDHEVKLLPDFFTVVKDEHWNTLDIQIHNIDCLFFRYLINTSRVHWRLELEERTKDLSEDERQKYLQENKFNIAGPLLSKEEQLEQKLHLINKMYSLGYLMHRYKDPSRPWAIFAMDNRISDEGESHGGSGKSIAYDSIRSLMTSGLLAGRDPKLTENPHVFDCVNKHTDFILVDDCNQYLKFNYFFSAITGALKVNPKNNKQYEIPFSEAPKFAFTSNYTLRDIDSSTERRILYTSFSDYYHHKSGDTYFGRTPKDDLGKNLFLDFNELEWNNYLNFMAQCCKMYMNHEKIDPPMDNVTTRNLLSEMGMSFNAWADVYFSEHGGRLNTFVVKEDAFKDFVSGNKLGWSSQKFTKAIKAWCKLNHLIYDPKDLHNAQGRIIRKAPKTIWKDGVAKTENVTAEMIYIQVPGTEIIKEEETPATEFTTSPQGDLPF